MKNIGGNVLALSLVLGFSLQASIVCAGESAEAAQIDRGADTTLKKFLENTPEADIFRKDASSESRG